MRKYALLGAVLVIAGAQAQINNTGAAGKLARAEAMAAQGNCIGALDVLRTVDFDALTPDEAAAMRFRQALYTYRTGRYADAMAAFGAFCRDYPWSPLYQRAMLGVADCRYAQADYAAALEDYRRCSAEALPDADAARMWYRSGVSALECGHKAQARAAFNAAARYSDTRTQALFCLGRMEFEEGNYSAARECFRDLNTNVPPADMADFYLARIELVEGNWSKALAAAKQMLRRVPHDKDVEAEMNRVAGEASFRLGQKAEAVAYLKKYIGAVSEPAPTALYILGVEDFAAGRYDDAFYRFLPVTERGTGALRQSAYLYAGQCLLERGDASAAILAFDKAAKATDDPEVREAAFYNYAVAKFAGADVPFASASQTFEEFLRLYPSGPYSDRVASYLAAGYMADNDYRRALGRINSVASPSPAILRAKQRVLYTLGLEAVRADRLDEARKYLDEAAALSRHDAAIAAEVTLARAELLAAEGKAAEAAAQYQLYLRMADKNAPNRPQALYGLAYALYNTGNASRAAVYFTEAQQVLAAAEAKADALNRLGDIRFALSDFEGADAYYASAYAANPAAGDYATLNAARMKGYMRDYEGKLRLLEAFGKDFGNSALMPDALLETTQAQISLGRNDAALDTYRALIARYPQTAQGRRGYLQMAMTLLDMEPLADAEKAYRSVISLYPTSDEAVQAASLLKTMYVSQGRADEYLRFMASVGGAPAVSTDDAEALSYESALAAWKKNSDTRQLEAFAVKYPSSKHTPGALGILLAKAEKEGDKARTRALAAQILSDFPDSRAAEQALRVQAEAAYAAGDLPQALERWQTLASKASDATTVTTARTGVMRTARDMADYTTAESAADAILASTEGSDVVSEARFTKALALNSRGQSKEATDIWLELAKNPADLFGAKGAYEAADALNESGDRKRALDIAQKLTRSGSPHRYWVARAFILISDIYSAQGKTFEAREYLEALRDNYPGKETDIFMMIESRLDGENVSE